MLWTWSICDGIWGSELPFLELCRTQETALSNRLLYRWLQRARSGEEKQPSTDLGCIPYSLELTWSKTCVCEKDHVERSHGKSKYVPWVVHFLASCIFPGQETGIWNLRKSSGFLILNGSEMNVLIDLALFSEFCNRLIFWSHGVLGWLIMSSTVIVHMTGSKVLRFQAYLNSRLAILKFLFVCFWF